MFDEYPGWTGMFTRAEAEGAIPNGSRIVKTERVDGDAHGPGALGTVLGSISTPAVMRQQHPATPYFYFIEWDDTPRVAVGVASDKIAEAG